MNRKTILALGAFLTVMVFVIFRMYAPSPGGSGIFTVTPDPTEKLIGALEENRPVFIEFYSSR